MKKFANYLRLVVAFFLILTLVSPSLIYAAKNSDGFESARAIQVNAGSSKKILDVRLRITQEDDFLAKNVVWDGKKVNFIVDPKAENALDKQTVALIWFIVYEENGKTYAYVDTERITRNELYNYTSYDVRATDVEMPYSMSNTYEDEKIVFYVRHLYDVPYNTFEYDMSAYKTFSLVKPIEGRNNLNNSMSFVYAAKDPSMSNPLNKYNIYINEFFDFEFLEDFKLDKSHFNQLQKIKYVAPVKTVDYTHRSNESEIMVFPMANELKTNYSGRTVYFTKEGEPGYWDTLFFNDMSDEVEQTINYQFKTLYLESWNNKSYVNNNQLILDDELHIITALDEIVQFTPDGTKTFDLKVNVYQNNQLINTYPVTTKDLHVKETISLAGYGKGKYQYQYTINFDNKAFSTQLVDFTVVAETISEEQKRVVEINQNAIDAQSSNAVIKYTTEALSNTVKQLNVTLTQSAAQRLLQLDKPFVLQAGDLELKVPTKVIQQLGANELKITLSLLSSQVTAPNQSAVSDFYSFNVQSNGRAIVNFNDYVEVKLPLKAFMNREKVAAYHVNDTTNAYEFVISKVVGNSLVFKTKHFSDFVALEGNATFNDIQNHWGRSHIEVLASKSIIGGKGNNQFDPNGRITRAEFAALISRMLNLPKTNFVGRFEDVKPNANGILPWYALEVEAAASAGIIQGSDGKFNPNAYISREQMTAIISRALYNANPSGIPKRISSLKFVDKDSISSYFETEIMVAVQLGIINGITTNNQLYFYPQRNATRAEAAKMLEVLLKNLMTE